MTADKIKMFYNTVLSQVIDSTGCFLFVGNNFGEVFVYSISQITDYLNAGVQSEIVKPNLTKPIQILKISEQSQIYSLSYYKDFLIIGLIGEVIGYKWSEKNKQIEKKIWEVKIPDCQEINSLYLNSKDDQLFAGCGDNNMYCISLEDGKILRNFTGHKDYIHCVDGFNSRIVTASEDGSVNLWDSRQCKITGTLEPYKDDNLNRPNFGKWQGTCSITDDWLVCGGGPKFSLWHLRSLECTSIFPFPEKLHVSGFIDDVIIAAGDSPHLYQYNFKGDVQAEIPVSASSVYSAVWKQDPYKIMSFGGASNGLDICTNFSYRDIVLKLYSN